MKLEIEEYGCLCELKVFKINDKCADYEDFGTKEDKKRSIAEPYGCGDMQFEARPPRVSILKKYGITKDEYEEICGRLDCLSFGHCGWCI